MADASESNRKKAAAFIDNITAKGGTAIDDALKKALETRPAGQSRPYVIVFLTDGLPTVGNTDENQIVSNATGRSGGVDSNTRIFCFGIGHDVNTHLLDKISGQTRGASQYVLPEEDIEVKVSNFFEKIKEPVLTRVYIKYPEGMRISKILPSELPDLFRGEQLVVVGRYSGHGEGPLLLGGMMNDTKQERAYAVRFPESSSENEFIPRLWATRRVGWLMDEIRLHGENAELKEEVTELARRYGIVTPYTSFLIVEDEKNRNVPLSAQTMPQLQTDTAMRGLAGRMYKESNVERSGAGAVARSRYGRAMQSAGNTADALGLAGVEAQRGLSAAGGVAAAAPPGAPLTALSTGVATEPPVSALTQQTRFVSGQNFFQSGNQWIDSRIQRQSNAAKVRVQFSSAEYFDLAAKRPEVRPWLALGRNVQFLLDNKIYEIYE
jgi:Ca-activated chloride channel family protein